MNLANLKRKIRKLKQAEKTIRTHGNMRNDIPLVWDKFFDLRDISKFAAMSKEAYKNMVDDFFARVYFEAYVYNGMSVTIYDPALLALLGLSPVADDMAIKKRFRELARRNRKEQLFFIRIPHTTLFCTKNKVSVNFHYLNSAKDCG